MGNLQLRAVLQSTVLDILAANTFKIKCMNGSGLRDYCGEKEFILGLQVSQPCIGE